MSVIVLLADGARHDTIDDATASGSLPALRRLREEGGLYPVTTTFPSVTGPAYTPFLMGRFPCAVGLPGLRWFDRARATCSFPDYTRSYVGYQIGAVDRDLSAEASTIFELVPESAGALSVINRGLTRRRQLKPLTPWSSLRAARTHFRGDVRRWLSVDREVAAAVVERVGRGEDRFLFAAFMGIDKSSHATGQHSHQATVALGIVDDTVAAVRDALERRGAWDDTHLWVVSDHGHSRVRHHEDLARVIAGFGHRVVAHPWVYRLRPTAAVMVSGNAMAHVYVDLDRRARPFLRGMSPAGRELAEALVGRESVDLLLAPLDANRCMVTSRTRGRALVSRDAGGDGVTYRTIDGDPLGLGADVVDADPVAAHHLTAHTDYPDALVQIATLAAADRVGDLILSAAPGWDFRARYEPIPHVSAHGALHRDHMIVPLLVNRPPARRPLRTADLMPSALRALGHPVPAGLDGESFL